MSSPIGYRSDVDGLRAIAVAVVVLFHAGLPGFSGGYVGVDVFFVISGFLITTLIVREIDIGSFSIARFYERRVRRIFPALFVVCAVTTVASSIVMSPMDLVDFAKSLAATAFFASNVYFWRTSDYFDAPAETKPLLHTWSLAVEEQYYVVVPVLLLVLAKLGVKKLGRVFWPLALASLAFGAWGVRAIPTSTFYLLPARFFEILAGGLVAVGAVPTLRSTTARDVSTVAGLALIGASVVLFTHETLFPGDGALLPVVGAALVVHGGPSGATRAGALLSSRPLVWLGLRSYSLYLWHWPLFALAKQALLRPLDVAEQVALVLLSLALADLSYRFVETPFRAHGAGARTSTRGVLAWSAAPMAASAALALALVVTDGLPQRFPGFVQEEIARGTKGSGRCMLTAAQSKEHYDDDACVVVADDEGPRVLLWGDSLAGHFRAGLDALASSTTSPGLTVVQYTATMCPPVFGWSSVARPHCGAFNDDVWRVVDEQRIDTVVLASRWQVVKGRRGGARTVPLDGARPA
mgnify:CR=1 FL=1